MKLRFSFLDSLPILGHRVPTGRFLRCMVIRIDIRDMRCRIPLDDDSLTALFAPHPGSTGAQQKNLRATKGLPSKGRKPKPAREKGAFLGIANLWSVSLFISGRPQFGMPEQAPSTLILSRTRKISSSFVGWSYNKYLTDVLWDHRLWAKHGAWHEFTTLQVHGSPSGNRRSCVRPELGGLPPWCRSLLGDLRRLPTYPGVSRRYPF